MLAVALMSLENEPTDADYEPPLPDIREADGWVYSSLPVAIRTLDRGRAIALERLRTAVSPTGEATEERSSVSLRLLSRAQLEREASGAGLVALECHEIEATEDHVGSLVVVFGRA
jgi:hypothetical protein